jgi:hypothetical protein
MQGLNRRMAVRENPELIVGQTINQQSTQATAAADDEMIGQPAAKPSAIAVRASAA